MAIQYDKQCQEDMDYRARGDYKIQKFFFVILANLVTWFLPGWIISIGSGNFHFEATVTNLLVLPGSGAGPGLAHGVLGRLLPTAVPSAHARR